MHALHSGLLTMLSGKSPVVECNGDHCDGSDRRRAQCPLPDTRPARFAFELPRKLLFADAAALQRVTARDASMHVIFKEQSARRRELFLQISRNQRLKVLATAQPA